MAGHHCDRIVSKGLRNYNFHRTATVLSDEWLCLIDKEFQAFRQMLEKYNVSDTNLIAGGGEYEIQEGFWLDKRCVSSHEKPETVVNLQVYLFDLLSISINYIKNFPQNLLQAADIFSPLPSPSPLTS